MRGTLHACKLDTRLGQGALEEVQKRYPALLLSLKGNKLLTKENLEKITRWHVHNASDLHSAALRLHQVLHHPAALPLPPSLSLFLSLFLSLSLYLTRHGLNSNGLNRKPSKRD
jgi:hypothetical protein